MFILRYTFNSERERCRAYPYKGFNPSQGIRRSNVPPVPPSCWSFRQNRHWGSFQQRCYRKRLSTTLLQKTPNFLTNFFSYWVRALPFRLIICQKPKTYAVSDKPGLWRNRSIQDSRNICVLGKGFQEFFGELLLSILQALAVQIQLYVGKTESELI